MIAGATPIENDLFDAFGDGGLGGQRTDGFGADSIGGQLFTIRRRLAGGGGSSERDAGLIVDELNVNVGVGKANAHPRTLFRAGDFLSDTPMAADGQLMFLFGAHVDVKGKT